MITYSPIILFISVILLLLGVFVFFRDRSSHLNFSFSILCLSSFLWLFSFSQVYSNPTISNELAIFWFKAGVLGVIFIPVAYYHLMGSFFLTKSLTKSIIFLYLNAIGFSYLLFETSFFMDGVYQYSWGTYPKKGDYHYLFLIWLSVLLTVSLIRAFSQFHLMKEDKSFKRKQVSICLSALVVFAFACVDFVPYYGYSILPFGFVCVFIFLILIAYALLRYQAFDESSAVSKQHFFVSTYSCVLLIPFIFAFGFQTALQDRFGENWWLVPLALSTVLATIGPLIYIQIQRRQEKKLIAEQQRYQSTLRQASLGMGQVKDLRRLLKLIVHVVTRAVKIKHCQIYFFHEESEKYALYASRGRKLMNHSHTIEADVGLIKYLSRTKQALLLEDINKVFRGVELRGLVSVFKELKASLIVPSFIEDKLICFFVLGSKRSGAPYTQDDMAIFSILANQSAIAIENALFYENMKKTQEQLFRAEKMATIGTMADGLSHQINNRLHSMGFIAGDAIDTIQIARKKEISQEIKNLVEESEGALKRIQDNVKRGGEVVEGLLKYTRKVDQGFEEVDLNELVDAAFEMAQFKVKTKNIEVRRAFPKDLPKVYGSFTQLQEVFFNVIDNAYDAMIQRKEELDEEGYKPAIRFSAATDKKSLVVFIEDNGMGVKEEDVKKLFTPFFTTKLSSKKGTGLGLYVIQKLIEDNHGGRIEFTSEYKKGSVMKVKLPIKG